MSFINVAMNVKQKTKKDNVMRVLNEEDING